MCVRPYWRKRCAADGGRLDGWSFHRASDASHPDAGDLGPHEAIEIVGGLPDRQRPARLADELRVEGLVDSRQGFGWFAATDPLRQTLGRLATVEGQLAGDGVAVTAMAVDPRVVVGAVVPGWLPCGGT